MLSVRVDRLGTWDRLRRLGRAPPKGKRVVQSRKARSKSASASTPVARGQDYADGSKAAFGKVGGLCCRHNPRSV